MRLFPGFLFIWFVLEVAALIVVGSRIGVLATLAIILLTAVAGSFLLRNHGLGALRKVQDEMAAGRDPNAHVADGLMIMVAGLLLVLPGLIGDAVGILLSLPPLRRLVWRWVKPRISIVSFNGFSGGRRGARTIDLDPQEYERTDRDEPASRANPRSPWRQIDHEP